MSKSGYRGRRALNTRIQRVAEEKGFYAKIWPGYQLMPVDNLPDELARRVDIGGGDIVLFAPDGHLIFVSHRFRQWKYLARGYLDFTVRDAEYERHTAAICNGGFVPGYFVCGYANEAEDDIVHLIAVKYRQMMRDISTGAFRLRFKKTKPGQENFYYSHFDRIPPEYVVYRFPEETNTAQQRTMALWAN